MCDSNEATPTFKRSRERIERGAKHFGEKRKFDPPPQTLQGFLCAPLVGSCLTPSGRQMAKGPALGANECGSPLVVPARRDVRSPAR